MKDALRTQRRAEKLGEMRHPRLMLLALIPDLARGVDVIEVGNRDPERSGRTTKTHLKRTYLKKQRGGHANASASHGSTCPAHPVLPA